MIKFSKIGAVYNVAKYIAHVNSSEEVPKDYEIRTPVRYVGTVKLHGTNSGVLCREDGTLVPQSRRQVISVKNDNMGFAKFVASHEEEIRKLAAGVRLFLHVEGDIVIYGEWIGPGIQSKVAICGLPTKQWVVFSARKAEEHGEYLNLANLPAAFEGGGQIFSVYDTPTWEVTIDYSDEDSKNKAVEYINEKTQEVGKRCPWAAKFGVEGIGEGIVWMPQDEHWGNTDLMFKSKTEDHKVKSKSPNKVSMDPEVLKSVTDFVDYSVTENRLRQGLDVMRELGHSLEMKSTKHFLGWLGNDVRTECKDELEASGLEWKQVSKKVNDKALAFWKEAVQSF